MRAATHSIAGARWALAHRIRRRRATRFFRQFVGPGSLCFDIGANQGLRTELFCALGAATVVAVEPQSDCVAALERRLLPRWRDVVRVERVAVGPPGMTTVALRVPRSHTIASASERWIDAVGRSGRFPGEQWASVVDTDVVTLDELIGRYGIPDFCKIDIEGFEAEALQGLSQQLPALSFEFVPEYVANAVACVARLVELGMTKFNVSYGETFELLWAEWADEASLLDFLLGREPGSAAGDVYARA